MSTQSDWTTLTSPQYSELAKTGSAVVKLPDGPPLLLIDKGNHDVIAMDATCTHQGCTVAYDAHAKVVKCPCHGSTFGIDCRVINGPASHPLKSYTAKVQGNSILMKG